SGAQNRDGETSCDTTNQHAGVNARKAQVNTGEGRVRDTAEETSGQRGARGLAHFWVFFTHGNSEHRSRSAEPSKVPSAHRALNEVITQRFNVHEHQSI